MLHVLLESGARSTAPRVRWTAASVLTHATLIGAAVALTIRDGTARIERIHAEPVVYVAPQAMNPPPPVRRESGTGLPGPELLRISLPAVPRIDASFMGAPDAADFRFDPPGSGLGPSVVSAVQSSGGVYTDQRVDRTVMPRNGNGNPAYPSQLRSSGIEGDVRVRFVVDSAGSVEPASITIIQATHALFGDAVRQWLLRTRYTPAELLGRPVRQLVEQHVAFTLRP